MDLNQLTRRIKFPEEFQKAFAKFWVGIGAKIVQSKSVAELTRYASAVVVESVQLFKGVVLPFESNMIQFIPPESEHFLITGIRIQEAVSVSLPDADWQPGASTPLIKNAQFTITNNGNIELQSEPGTAFLDELTTRDQGYLDLKQPIAWIGQTPLTVVMNTNPGSPIPLNTVIRVELIGIGYIS